MFGEIFRAVAGIELIPHRWRPALLRAAGYSVGRDVLVYGGCVFAGEEHLQLHADVFVNRQCYFDLQSPISVDSGARLGDHVRLITSTHELGSGQRRVGMGRSEPIHIGAGVWLGSGCTVLPGVTVRDGCVVAAGAVVTKSTNEDGLYAGVPARRIRNLESTETESGSPRSGAVV